MSAYFSEYLIVATTKYGYITIRKKNLNFMFRTIGAGVAVGDRGTPRFWRSVSYHGYQELLDGRLRGQIVTTYLKKITFLENYFNKDKSVSL